MGMFCLNLMRMALELARENPVYENIATKFFEHFLGIAGAMNNVGGQGIGLWDEADEFYYDVLHMPDGRYLPSARPFARGTDAAPRGGDNRARAARGDARLSENVSNGISPTARISRRLISRWNDPGAGERRRLIALTRGHRMKCLAPPDARSGRIPQSTTASVR